MSSKRNKNQYLRNIDYYVLTPIADKSLTIQVPVDSNSIRSIITKEEVKQYIMDTLSK